MRKKKDSHGVPTFSKKYNGTKQKSKSHHSIMHKHESKLLEFKKQNDQIKNIDSKIRNIEGLLKKQNITKKRSNENIEDDIASLRLNKYKLEDLKKERDKIISGKEEMDYLLESSSIIMEYIELEEREHYFLNIKDLTPEQNIELNDLYTKKNELVDLYLHKFEPGYTNQKREFKQDSVQCSECKTTLVTEHSFLVCPSCGKCAHTVEQATDLSYKELQDFDYRPQFTYDKMTHLEDWLRRFQAKENRGIPQEILDKVLLEANKERIQDLNTLTEDKIKKYLKKLNLNDYYDNVIGIINRLNGRPPFTLTSEIEEKIKIMFQQIQDPYENFKPKGRKNFLSYSYTLHKFFQIIGLHEFAKYFPLLKSTDKLRQQDDIFKKIVGYMSQNDTTTKWVFYPSI
jgi:hypothetical protein